MKIRTAFAVLAVGALLVVLAAAQPLHPPADSSAAGPGAGTEQAKKPAATPTGGDYVGSAVCITCHEDQNKRFKNTVMGKILEHPRTANEKLGCESCHGAGKAHVDAGGGKETVAINFGKGSKNSIEEQNATCLSCHSKGNRMFWKGSPHDSRGMACVDCHQVMGANKSLLSKGDRFKAPLTEVKSVKASEPELCFQCHQMRRAQLQRSSHMPFREGKVTCSSCHNPHGTPNPKQLIQATVNENCYSCHAERRGPFLWEHPPVMENCSNCHEAHGSTNPQLLKARQPRLCNSCHMNGGHPTNAYGVVSSGGVVQTQGIRVINRGCTTCHSTVHGSNHPSGNHFRR